MKQSDEQIQELVDAAIGINKYGYAGRRIGELREVLKPFLPVNPRRGVVTDFEPYEAVELTDEVKAALEIAGINYQFDSD